MKGGRLGRPPGGSPRRRASASRPRPELLRVAYCPDVLDPVAGDVERDHYHGDAILLSRQAGLTVDGTFQDRQVGCPAGDIDDGARDRLAAFDGAEYGADQAAAVGDRGGVRVEEADERIDVLGFPCLLEVPDYVCLLGCRSRRSLRRMDAAAGRRGQLATCRRLRPTISATSVKGLDIVEDERDPLGRGHRFEHHEEGHVDRLVEGDSIGRICIGTGRPPNDPLRTFWQRFRDPFAHVALPPGSCRAEQVEADATGDLGQPAAGDSMASCCCGDMAYQRA
jgi:hypothetical protein